MSHPGLQILETKFEETETMVMMEESMDWREDLQEPENGGTRGGQRPDEPDPDAEPEPGAGNEYPANGGTRGTAPASTAAAQQHPSTSIDTGR